MFLHVPRKTSRVICSSDSTQKKQSRKSGNPHGKTSSKREISELVACTWNLHGKHVSALSNLLNDTEDPPDFLCVQELGGFSKLTKGETTTESITISGAPFTMIVYQAPLAHHAVGILFQDRFDVELRKQHLFGTGIVLQLRTHGRSFWLGSGHLPHQQRPDAEDVWLSSLTRLDEILSEARFCDVIAMGMDCNQNLLHENPSFAALSRIHILLKYRGLEFNPACGPTWTARGEASICTGFFSGGL